MDIKKKGKDSMDSMNSILMVYKHDKCAHLANSKFYY